MVPPGPAWLALWPDHFSRSVHNVPKCKHFCRLNTGQNRNDGTNSTSVCSFPPKHLKMSTFITEHYPCFLFPSTDFPELSGQLRPQHVELRARLYPLWQRYSGPVSAERKSFKRTHSYFICPSSARCSAAVWFFFLNLPLHGHWKGWNIAVTFHWEPSISFCLDRRSEAQHALFGQISNTVGNAHIASPAIINSVPAGSLWTLWKVHKQQGEYTRKRKWCRIWLLVFPKGLI